MAMSEVDILFVEDGSPLKWCSWIITDSAFDFVRSWKTIFTVKSLARLAVAVFGV